MLKLAPLYLFAASAVLSGCMQLTDEQSAPAVVNQPATPKNIIMVVADGMGPAYTTAYRLYQDNPDTQHIEPVIFDEILVGNASTHPHHTSGYVTDSAAAATALASGVKSYNGAIGVDVDKQPLESVMMRAKAKGKRTGLAVTSQIVHATPASYIAHNESRKNYDLIANDFYDNRVDGKFIADVMLGGGTRYFERKDRDVLAQFIDAGYQYSDSYNRLAAIPAGSNVLGLFGDVALPAVLDDNRKDRLAYLTGHAIRHLENPNGFFLLVEASQVDWAGHSNDIASAMAEMHDLAQTMVMLKDYVKQHPDTLVVLTADHSTGGLTIGANGDYRWDPNPLKQLKASVPAIAAKMAEQDDPALYVQDMTGIALDAKAQTQVAALAKESDVRVREQGLKAWFDQMTNTGWTTSGHTGVDVEVFAFGAGAGQFAGQLDNTDIAKTIFSFIEASPTAVISDVESTPTQPESVVDNTQCDLTPKWLCD